jgi:hypothetical protein
MNPRKGGVFQINGSGSPENQHPIGQFEGDGKGWVAPGFRRTPFGSYGPSWGYGG